MARHFTLDRAHAKLWGVCAGIANYLDIHPLIVRVGFVAATLAGFGMPVIVYGAIALLAPDDVA